MTNELNEAVKLIAELDAKRTQGEWTHSNQNGEAPHCFIAQVWDAHGNNLAEISPSCGETIASNTAAFIAAAPLMAATVAQQAAIIEQQLEEIATLRDIVFEPCCATEATIQAQREALNLARDRLYQARDFMPEGEVIFIDAALTAIDNVKKN